MSVLMSIKKLLTFKQKGKLYFNINRAKGSFFGQAIGDALGLGSEFMAKTEVQFYYPNGLSEYSQIRQDKHRRRWKKGDWTDDTDMMLCIANAIIRTGNADVYAIAKEFKSWFNGTAMGIGQNTYNVLSLGDYEADPCKAAEIVWNLSGKKSAANGALMRTSVIGLLATDVETSAVDACKTTHADPRCIGSCVIVSSIIHELVYHEKELTYEEIMAIGAKYNPEIETYITKAYYGSIEDVALDDESMGYTLYTLFAALWCYFHANSFEEGLLRVVNEGGDADTNAAVACAILGAKYGYSNIPSKYTSNLNGYNTILQTFNNLREKIIQSYQR